MEAAMSAALPSQSPIAVSISVAQDDRLTEFEFTVDPSERGEATVDLENVLRDDIDGYMLRSVPTGLVNFRLDLTNARATEAAR
jgi:hypothetical protein